MRYLVATDGSEEAAAAVAYASSQALAFDATLDIVHVLTPETKLVDGEIVLAGGDKAMEIGDRILQEAQDVAREVADNHGGELAIETQLLTGSPPDAIVEYSYRTDIDAIYVGHRGETEKREPMVGSVAKSVLDKATVPVTVTR